MPQQAKTATVAICSISLGATAKSFAMRLRFYLHAGLWFALFAAFLALSMRDVAHAVLENKIGPVNRNHSTDSYLDGLTHIRNGSESFSRLIETLPREKSIVIVVDAQSSPSKFLGMLVAYLSWPRDVQTVAVTPATYSRELAAIKESPVGAAIFCALKPPVWVKNKTDVGSNIILVPAESLNPPQ
jgi:hypothetical protein